MIVTLTATALAGFDSSPVYERTDFLTLGPSYNVDELRDDYHEILSFLKRNSGAVITYKETPE